MDRAPIEHIYSAVSTLADVTAVACELAEHHADDNTARVFGWLSRETEKARESLAAFAENMREGRTDE
jgi:hypothetical protein